MNRSVPVAIVTIACMLLLASALLTSPSADGGSTNSKITIPDLGSEGDWDVYQSGSLEITGTYSGTVSFYSGTQSLASDLLATVVCSDITGVTLSGDTESPYAIGNLSAGTITVTYGSVLFGNDTEPYTGKVLTGTLSVDSVESRGIKITPNPSVDITDGEFTGTIRQSETLLISADKVCGIKYIETENENILVGELSSGTVELKTGSVLLGDESLGFTGTVTGGEGSITSSHASGTVLTMSDELTISSQNSIISSVGIGFAGIVSFEETKSFEGADGNAVKMNGRLSNSLLGNSLSLVSVSENTYKLTGTLSYVDTSGKSPEGIMLSFMAGAETHHALVMGAGSIPSVNNIAVSDFYIIPMTSSIDEITVGDITLDVSELVLAGPEDTVVQSDMPYSSVAVSGKYIMGNISTSSSVSFILNGDATAAADSEMSWGGSLQIDGNADFSDADVFTAGAAVIPYGTLTLLSDSIQNEQNIHSFYRFMNGSTELRSYSADINIISKSSATQVSGSVIISGDLTITPDKTLVNKSGTMFFSKDFIIIKGTISNQNAGIILKECRIDVSDGTFENPGYMIAYGILKIKGTTTSAVYCDLSNYSSGTVISTFFGNFDDVLSSAVSNDSLTLMRNLYVDGDFTLGTGVLFSSKHEFRVSGTASIFGQMSLSGYMQVNTLIIDKGTVSVSERNIVDTQYTNVLGKLNAVGTLTVGTRLTVGASPTTLPYQNNATVSGNIDLKIGTSAIVYGICPGFQPSVLGSDYKQTKFMVQSNIYVTEYSVSDCTLYFPEHKFSEMTVSGWYDFLPGGENLERRSFPPLIGEYDTVYGRVLDFPLEVTFADTKGVTWYWDDKPVSGTITEPYGTHFVKVELSEGYSGTPTIYMGGTAVDSDGEVVLREKTTFTVSGISESGLDIPIWAIAIVAILAIIALVWFFVIRPRTAG